MKIKKILSSVLLIVLFTLQFSNVALAVSVSEDAFTNANDGITNLTIYDYKIGGGTNNDDHHILGVNTISSPPSVSLVHLVAPDGDSNFTMTVLADIGDDLSVPAKMVLDSDGDPHVAWATSGANTTVYYKEKSGSTWYSTVTVQTSTNSSGVGLDLFQTDGGTSFTGQEDANDPIITVCDDGTNYPVLAYYTVKDASGTGNSLDFIDSPAVGGSEQITGNGSYGCHNTEMELTSDSQIEVVGIKDNQDNSGNIFHCMYYSSSWSCSNVVTNVYKWDGSGYGPDERDTFPIPRLIDTGSGYGLVYTTTNSADTASTVKFVLYSEGSWGTPVTVAGGTNDFGENMSDVVYDSANERFWVTYFDEDNDNLYIAYSDDDGSTWTTSSSDSTLKIDTSMTIDNTEPSTYSAIAFDTVPAADVLYVAASANYTAIAARYKITSLPSGGGGQGGGGVPEFSTYVYVTTALLMFGMVYWKKERDALHG